MPKSAKKERLDRRIAKASEVEGRFSGLLEAAPKMQGIFLNFQLSDDVYRHPGAGDDVDSENATAHNNSGGRVGVSAVFSI